MSPFALGGWRIDGSQPAFWVLSCPHGQQPFRTARWGATGRICSSSRSVHPGHGGRWLFHRWLLLCWRKDASPDRESSPILDTIPNQESPVFCSTCRSGLNIAMAEPGTSRFHAWLWKSMLMEDWTQKKIPETTKDAFLIVCQLMFFVFTSRSINCGAVLAQLKEWFDYQPRKKGIDLKAGKRSRLKARLYIWAKPPLTQQNTSVLALLFL